MRAVTAGFLVCMAFAGCSRAVPDGTAESLKHSYAAEKEKLNATAERSKAHLADFQKRLDRLMERKDRNSDSNNALGIANTFDDVLELKAEMDAQLLVDHSDMENQKRIVAQLKSQVDPSR